LTAQVASRFEAANGRNALLLAIDDPCDSRRCLLPTVSHGHKGTRRPRKPSIPMKREIS
jgi:hypothetical protein